jgi:protein-disulfide isomerase
VSDSVRLTLPVGPRDHAQGPDEAPVTLLEYGDFECPQCGLAFPIVKELQRIFGARLRFVFRHFPLTSSHAHAQRAAETAEWAAAQQLFWPMHDDLYTHQGALGDRAIGERVAAMGLDAASLRQAWAAHTFIPRVKEDFLGGIASGVGGTPAFFVNGARHPGAWDLETLGRALDDAAAQRSG